MHYTAASELIDAFSVFVGPEVEDEGIDLIRAALVVARTEYSDLDIERYASRVEEVARRVASLAPDLQPQRTLGALNHVLFGELKLRGNREDYYDPRNSFLNDVMDRGLGIPITLAIVYMEVARRVGFRLSGVGMPGHFLLKHYSPEGQEMLIDCFNRGDVLSRKDCQSRLDEIYSGEMKLPDQPPSDSHADAQQPEDRLSFHAEFPQGARDCGPNLGDLSAICRRCEAACVTALQHEPASAGGGRPRRILENFSDRFRRRRHSPNVALDSQDAGADELDQFSAS